MNEAIVGTLKRFNLLHAEHFQSEQELGQIKYAFENETTLQFKYYFMCKWQKK